jgi:hypothetical protein
MQKNRLMLAMLVVALFASYSTAIVFSSGNSITVNPGVIPQGGTVVITVTTVKAASGTLMVTYEPTNTQWTSLTPLSIGAGGGSQSWTFPSSDFPGSNTDNIGNYVVNATINWLPVAHFTVEFFVVPDLPFGTLMAVVACFGAFISYKKLKQ